MNKELMNSRRGFLAAMIGGVIGMAAVTIATFNNPDQSDFKDGDVTAIKDSSNNLMISIKGKERIKVYDV